MNHDTKVLANAIRAALRQREENIRDEQVGEAPTAEDLGERWCERVAPVEDAPERASQIIDALAGRVCRAKTRKEVGHVLRAFAERAAGFHA